MCRTRNPNVTIRWLHDDREVQEIARISEACFGVDGWTPERIRHFANGSGHVPKVIVTDQVVGYFFCVLHESVIEIREITVAPQMQRHGLGSMAITSLIESMPRLHKTILAAVVPEGNLPAQLFFKTLGFEWCRTLNKNLPNAQYGMKYVIAQELREQMNSGKTDDLCEEA